MAIGTDNADAPIVIVDLSTWEARPVPLTEAGEVGLALTSNPNVLLHRNDVSNQVESYRLEQALAGNVAPASTVQIGAFGHGEAYDPATGRFYIATDDGVDVVILDGAKLEFVSTVPWETADRSGGRAYFHRLNADGTALVTYLANREAPEAEWGTWENDLFMVDANTLESTRTPLGNGYLLRYTLSHETALFTVVHFDGDVTHSVDLANGDVVGEVSLDPMTNAPVDGAAPWEAENRTTAITPDGSLGFVTQGGDGIIVVIDVESQAIHSTITVDTVLGYGGYLGVFGTADIVFDLIGR
jgi:DNA-binding beta-propeller fold protein YncE